jgi:DNA-binding PadR family transcriptional regulator
MLKIEQAGLVIVHKEFIDRKPHTTYICTAKGRIELENYLLKIESILKNALSKTKKGKK